MMLVMVISIRTQKIGNLLLIPKVYSKIPIEKMHKQVSKWSAPWEKALALSI